MTSLLQTDSDVIFADLDHDGDGKINFEDFSFGFRDFLTPGSRRGSLQLGLLPGGETDTADHPNIQVREQSRITSSPVLEAFVQKLCNAVVVVEAMEAKHQKAQKAWRTFADSMGKDNIRKFLSTSGDKMLTLFEVNST